MNGQPYSPLQTGGNRNTTMKITGVVLIVIAMIALIGRDSIVTPMKEKAAHAPSWTESQWRESQRMQKEAELTSDIIQYGGYAVGAVGLVLLAVGLVGYFQQTSSSTIAQTATDTQSPQKVIASERSIPEQIEQLAKLKAQGILSEAEFEEKKKELLSRL